MSVSEKQESEIAILKDIRFQSEKGFVIGMFSSQEPPEKRKLILFCGLGNMANPEIGISYKLFGNWKKDNQWGLQFKFQFYEVLQPVDTKGIYQYLVRVCKYVGPTVAGKIVGKYKTKSLEILKSNPVKVASDIKGLTVTRAREIQKNLKESEHIEKVLIKLEKVFASVSGVRKSLPMELVKRWGSDAAVKLKENPYILTRFRGIGFLTADKVALDFGYDRKAVAREKACVWYVLNENMHRQGSVWMDSESLKETVTELTGLAGETGIARLNDEKIIVGNNDFWALSEIDRNETYIAEKAARMV